MKETKLDIKYILLIVYLCIKYILKKNCFLYLDLLLCFMHYLYLQ